MSMGFMVAAASRRRDERGRYAEGDNDRRMEGNYGNYGRMGNDHSTYMGGNYSRMNDTPEMRRRRDSRGRYMEDDGGSRMEYDGNQGNYSRMDDEPEMRRRRDSRGRYMDGGTSARYMPWPEPHIPPYLDVPDMREERNIRPGRERREDPRMAREPVRMRDRNVVNIRDYQDKRRIGFGENRTEDDDDDEEEGDEEIRHGGLRRHESYPLMEQLTEEMASSWVGKMKNADPEHTTGAKWSRETIKPIAAKHGFTTPEKQLEFWTVMNMMYSDYADIAKKHGVSTLDFFGDMAKAWMKDPDAVKHKTAAYIACCTE